MKRRNLRIAVLFLVIISLFSSILTGQPLSETRQAEKLVILATTDIHGNVWGFSYEDDKETTNTGMARIATYVESVRDEEEFVILVDNGDVIQGNIMTDDLYNKREGEHPVMRAMNLLGYDAMTLGNPEFNIAEDLFKRI